VEVNAMFQLTILLGAFLAGVVPVFSLLLRLGAVKHYGSFSDGPRLMAASAARRLIRLRVLAPALPLGRGDGHR
jgi:hypothetical protein